MSELCRCTLLRFGIIFGELVWWVPLAIYRRVGGTRSSVFPLFLQVISTIHDDKTEICGICVFVCYGGRINAMTHTCVFVLVFVYLFLFVYLCLCIFIRVFVFPGLLRRTAHLHLVYLYLFYILICVFVFVYLYFLCCGGV